jgi:hypothetical protein
MSGISVHPNAPFSRMKQNMVEGFTTGDVFEQVLRMPKSSIVPTKAVPGKSSGVTNTNSGSCPTTAATTTSTSSTVTPTITPYTPPPFLKKLIQDEKNSVESLLRTAAKIGPMANTVIESENASDAAFMAKEPAPIPTYGSTIQGFTFILFFWSYVSLAIVGSIYINQTTGNTANAVGTFIGSIVLLVLIFGIIKRFA